jgi:hypothetical protein
MHFIYRHNRAFLGDSYSPRHYAYIKFLACLSSFCVSVVFLLHWPCSLGLFWEGRNRITARHSVMSTVSLCFCQSFVPSLLYHVSSYITWPHYVLSFILMHQSYSLPLIKVCLRDLNECCSWNDVVLDARSSLCVLYFWSIPQHQIMREI